MNGHPRHPGTEELAEFRAGVTDGAHGDRLATHLAECPDCASVGERLDQVSVILASLPQAVMPGNIEARISESLAAEAARRNSTRDSAAVAATALLPGLSPEVTSASPASGSPVSSSSPPRTRLREWWRSPLTASLGGFAAAAACLVLAFVGFRLSDAGHPASSAAPRVSHVHAGPNIPAGAAPGPHHDNLSPAHGPLERSVPFDVFVSSTNFRQPTLKAQVLQQFPATALAPGGGTRIAPSRSLVGCVMHLTGHASPSFVEEASYQSRPVYVIAVPARAWVVARDCTAANTAVLASVALTPRR